MDLGRKRKDFENGFTLFSFLTLWLFNSGFPISKPFAISSDGFVSIITPPLSDGVKTFDRFKGDSDFFVLLGLRDFTLVRFLVFSALLAGGGLGLGLAGAMATGGARASSVFSDPEAPKDVTLSLPTRISTTPILLILAKLFANVLILMAVPLVRPWTTSLMSESKPSNPSMTVPAVDRPARQPYLNSPPAALQRYLCLLPATSTSWAGLKPGFDWLTQIV